LATGTVPPAEAFDTEMSPVYLGCVSQQSKTIVLVIVACLIIVFLLWLGSHKMRHETRRRSQAIHSRPRFFSASERSPLGAEALVACFSRDEISKRPAASFA
jgi:ABC-type protease/lipase transport system fused ATPase/permease subunit